MFAYVHSKTKLKIDKETLPLLLKCQGWILHTKLRTQSPQYNIVKNDEMGV